MNTKEQTEEFLENSRPAITHLFGALSDYYEVLKKAQMTVEEIEKSKQRLSDLFMYRDQWSPNANHHYAQYITRMQDLKNQKKEMQVDDVDKLEKALASMGVTIESMSCLAGAVLQIAKQTLSLRHSGKPDITGAKQIGLQSVIEVIWEGRNHAMHWDEGAPRDNVRIMLNGLETDLDIIIELGQNNCLSILGALGWKTTDDVESDLRSLVQ